MKRENTEIVMAQQEIDLGNEARKQLSVFATDSLECARRPAKAFAECAVDYLLNRFICWVDEKLSA